MENKTANKVGIILASSVLAGIPLGFVPGIGPFLTCGSLVLGQVVAWSTIHHVEKKQNKSNIYQNYINEEFSFSNEENNLDEKLTQNNIITKNKILPAKKQAKESLLNKNDDLIFWFLIYVLKY